MFKLEIFDPAMCCSTGVCGPVVDPVLPRFSADLEWLKSGGVVVERFNLAQQPQAFAANETVKQAMKEDGMECLPLILLDGRIVSRGAYPGRQELAELLGLPAPREPNPVLLPMADLESACDPSSNCC
ncbi:arsenite efflux transporter metallochaperone ArsD [Desulfoferrobacter suflitae]|uniref:arsenite efflux transporter metallochaperone ArsD n=1 Tax=Desulfoferrobacter suflitae TaxID=2865782 RepID=UPI002164D559|nr:arsenite efflux transporter metallochaperone ArsD [Desulfoferrobacter suflitae]MCK8603709.1 arsenite efflux transporter metallochaperone ArsD [Desulfoferrobacter suflitae]